MPSLSPSACLGSYGYLGDETDGQVQCLDILCWEGNVYCERFTREYVFLIIWVIVVVVKEIRQTPVRFDDATLGRTVDEYCSWIARPNRYTSPHQDGFSDRAAGAERLN